MACENEACPLRLKGECFTASFLGREALFQANRLHWELVLGEENARRATAQMTPLTAEELRTQKRSEALETAKGAVTLYCRPEDTALRHAIESFDAVIVA
jgi:hypothetical protein